MLAQEPIVLPQFEESAAEQASILRLQLDGAQRSAYARLTIEGPLTDGETVQALETLTDEQLLREFRKSLKRVYKFDLLSEGKRIRISKKLVRQWSDPPRFVPLIGMVSRHHAYYKYVIYEFPAGAHGAEADTPAEFIGFVHLDHHHLHMLPPQPDVRR